MKKLSAKQKIVNYLAKNSDYGLTTNQARAKFGITNVAARIEELRKEGHCIYTNTKKRADGTRFHVYRYGKPTKALVRAAISAGFSFTNPHSEA